MAAVEIIARDDKIRQARRIGLDREAPVDPVMAGAGSAKGVVQDGDRAGGGCIHLDADAALRAVGVIDHAVFQRDIGAALDCQRRLAGRLLEPHAIQRDVDCRAVDSDFAADDGFAGARKAGRVTVVRTDNGDRMTDQHIARIGAFRKPDDIIRRGAACRRVDSFLDRLEGGNQHATCIEQLHAVRQVDREVAEADDFDFRQAVRPGVAVHCGRHILDLGDVDDKAVGVGDQRQLVAVAIAGILHRVADTCRFAGLPAREAVIAGTANKRVVARSAAGDIVAAGAIKAIVTRATGDDVDTAGAGHVVIAAAHGDIQTARAREIVGSNRAQIDRDVRGDVSEIDVADDIVEFVPVDAHDNGAIGDRIDLQAVGDLGEHVVGDRARGFVVARELDPGSQRRTEAVVVDGQVDARAVRLDRRAPVGVVVAVGRTAKDVLRDADISGCVHRQVDAAVTVGATGAGCIEDAVLDGHVRAAIDGHAVELGAGTAGVGNLHAIDDNRAGRRRHRDLALEDGFRPSHAIAGRAPVSTEDRHRLVDGRVAGKGAGRDHDRVAGRCRIHGLLQTVEAAIADQQDGPAAVLDAFDLDQSIGAFGTAGRDRPAGLVAGRSRIGIRDKGDHPRCNRLDIGRGVDGAAAAVEQIVARAAFKRVVVFIAEQPVAAGSAPERVVSGAAVQFVGIIAAAQDIIAAIAEELVRTAATIDGVVHVAAVDDVAAVAGVEDLARAIFARQRIAGIRQRDDVVTVHGIEIIAVLRVSCSQNGQVDRLAIVGEQHVVGAVDCDRDRLRRGAALAVGYLDHIFDLDGFTRLQVVEEIIAGIEFPVDAAACGRAGRRGRPCNAHQRKRCGIEGGSGHAAGTAGQARR